MGYFNNPPDDNLIEKTDSLLRANKNVPFVKRILKSEKYPVRPNEDGGSSTHLMRHEVDEKGNWHVFPMLKYEDGEYYEYNNWQDAFKDALESGNTINLGKDASMAEEFSKGDKTWKSWIKQKASKKTRRKRIKPRLRLTDIRARYKSFNLNKRDNRRIT
jgi:hypothetical protein